MTTSFAKRAFRKIYRTVNEKFDFIAAVPCTAIVSPSYPFEMQKNLIVDLGMNDGADTLFYLKKGFNVIAIEANPALVKRTRRRFSRFIEAGALRILNFGITDAASGHLDFYVNHTRSEWSSFIKEIGTRGSQGFSIKQIPMISLHDLFYEFGTPYYLKIDVEGYDRRIIGALAELPNRPNLVSAEESGVEMVDALSNIGAVAFKLSNQRNHPAISLPKRAREGGFCRHYFVGGSSGPFGDEVPGNWMNYKDFRSLFLSKCRDETGNAVSPADWFDIHAKFI
jgi:FkbM family methyltransferase